MFKFEVKRVSGVRNRAADALSRKPTIKDDTEDKLKRVVPDDFIDAESSSVRVLPQEADDTSVPRSQAGHAIGNDASAEDDKQSLLEDDF
jgi:hypothetical protein